MNLGIAEVPAIVKELTLKQLAGSAGLILPLIYLHSWLLGCVATENASKLVVQIIKVGDETCNTMSICVPCNVLINFHFITRNMSWNRCLRYMCHVSAIQKNTLSVADLCFLMQRLHLRFTGKCHDIT